MRTSVKAVARALVAVVATATVVLAVGAGSASAASWTPLGPVKQVGTLTLKVAGGSPTVCTVNFTGNAFNFISYSMIGFSTTQVASCAGGVPFNIATMGHYAESSGGVRSVRGWMGYGYSPWGDWSGYSTHPDAEWRVPFTNGTPGGASSQMVFSNTKIGYDAGDHSRPLTLSGVLTVTTPTGGLVTITP